MPDFARSEELYPKNRDGKSSEVASVSVHSENQGCLGGNSSYRDEVLCFYSLVQGTAFISQDPCDFC